LAKDRVSLDPLELCRPVETEGSGDRLDGNEHTIVLFESVEFISTEVDCDDFSHLGVLSRQSRHNAGWMKRWGGKLIHGRPPHRLGRLVVQPDIPVGILEN